MQLSLSPSQNYKNLEICQLCLSIIECFNNSHWNGKLFIKFPLAILWIYAYVYIIYFKYT